MPNSLIPLSQIIRTRRSVKPEQFDPNRAVPLAVIEEMLENANWAPTHGLNEPWYFVIFKGAGRQKLAEFLAEHYKEHTPTESYKEGKYQKTLNRPTKATYVVAICMKRKENTRIPVIEDIEAVACAVQNMHLTVTTHGLAGYWTSGGATYSEELKDFLGLGAEDQCLGFFYVGYIDMEWPEGRRTPIEDKITWVD